MYGECHCEAQFGVAILVFYDQEVISGAWVIARKVEIVYVRASC